MIYGDGGHAKVIRDIQVNPDSSWIVGIGDNAARKKEAERLTLLKQRFAVAIHPFSFVSPTAKIGEGTVIMAGAVVQADAVIGRHCIVNTCASVDHDCVLEDFVHIAPGAHLCGGVKVGEGGFVGTGVCIAQGYRVPAWKLIKATRIRPEDTVGIVGA